MPPAARIGDMHVCPMVTPGVPPIPHVGGPIITGCVTVLVGGMPAARVTDKAICVGPPDLIVRGSLGVMICKLPAARIGDNTAHGGAIIVGLPTVIIGEIGGGGGGGAGGAGGFPLPIVRLPNGDVQVGNNIIIKGDALFQFQVMQDLATMSRTPTGLARLNSIDAGNQPITINPDRGNGNETQAANYTDASAKGGPVLGNPGAVGTGNGSPSDIYYNSTPRPTAADPSINRPGDVALNHELTHADGNAHGTGDFRPDPANPNNGTREETSVIDQDNLYRDDRGIPRRRDHTTL